MSRQFIPNRGIALPAAFIHSGKHRFSNIDVVVDLNKLLSVEEAMEPTDILLGSSFSGDRHCQKKRIEPRIVESFSDVTSRSQN